MSISDQTTPDQTETLRFEFDLRHAPEKVWRALTEPALLAQWLLPMVEGSLELGTAFKLQTNPQPGWDGSVQCRVIERQELRMLSYTWVVGDMDTVVTFFLSATSTGTRLLLEHAGFKPTQKQNFGGARYGWKLMGKRLLDVLDAENQG